MSVLSSIIDSLTECAYTTSLCPLFLRNVSPFRAALTMEDRANGLTKHAQVLAIAGSTNSGKTTIADHLKTILGDDGKKIVQIVHQDDYYMLKEKVEKIIRPEGSVPSFYWDYDSPTSVDRTAFVEAVRMAKETADFVIVEGNMITELEEILAFCDQLIFLTMDKTTCLRRRLTRSYDPPDEDGYFDGVAWPAYLSHLQRALQLARNDPRITFIDVSTTNDVATRENVLSIIEAFSNDFIRITSSPLNPDEAARYVTSPSCGGISIFVGTTRNTFEGKEVLRLEYECYDEMVYKELRKLCSELRKKHPSVEKLFVIHRLGLVPVEEASVIIATSSPHRKDAIEATEFAIDELKRTVPIWKKEVYANGEGSWKANSDCCHEGKGHKKDAQVPKKPTVSAPTIFWRK